MDGRPSPEELLSRAGAATSSHGRPPVLPLIDPRLWTDPAPPRCWIVPGYVPVGVVSALYGDGGIGKTLAAQQLTTAAAVGAEWIGLPVRTCRTLGVYCEDDAGELQRRQEAINAALGIGMADLSRMRLLSRLGEDNALVGFDGPQGRLTAFHGALRQVCEEWRPELVVLDTAADLYPDNENDRSKVRWFVQTALASIARDFNCGLLLLAHPSASGLTLGTGTGGSTAWNNTVRSRLYLSKAEGAAASPNGRVLSRKKANYAAQGGDIKLLWRDGVLHTDVAPAGSSSLPWSDIDVIFTELDRAWQAGPSWSNTVQAKRAGRYFPAWAAQKLGLPEKRVLASITDWLMSQHLSIEERDGKSKERGLRVLRRLHP